MAELTWEQYFTDDFADTTQWGKSNENWERTTDQYYSSPYSISGTSASSACILLCNASGTTLSEAKIEAKIYLTGYRPGIYMIFRNQGEEGFDQNYYYVMFTNYTGAFCQLNYVEDGGFPVMLDQSDFYVPLNEWATVYVCFWDESDGLHIKYGVVSSLGTSETTYVDDTSRFGSGQIGFLTSKLNNAARYTDDYVIYTGTPAPPITAREIFVTGTKFGYGDPNGYARVLEGELSGKSYLQDKVGWSGSLWVYGDANGDTREFEGEDTGITDTNHFIGIEPDESKFRWADSSLYKREIEGDIL